ncbi:ScbR family autoregulator-binding transcription factor [Streptomyces europaeiscabiei]|uniref:ScbR family autoregulator-binding transcription factor n=1 Tax=Streptomyces europaeiscabiei TaxID=146819 RepID=A0ABU4NXI9_9ACTN|nr:ScbR family autoregulator-binding transcription factor [Streptomyces europaeiscabiei]MDX2531366.1 ScbR family autoregulator-binding transcription factor [Streptomyces europaeiscabiei]MDX2759403.1 ScbR family autoregulator-binding transcription factor [Streptomyces europaeiscabiei]MDX2769024.1 ScbR family autoregulator-binding transcription factor [Streptomyces europaeiscabiei]MDX3549851.1 ScbR family autoregulator-binding transcription factor [Streptomyces europaeiscabiei]MDX3559005.1 ScbR 
MARQERALRTRRAILDAAGEVFAEHGYAGATIQDVYNRCGVTKGAFYFHFTSKVELAQAVLDEQVSGQIQYLDVPPRERTVQLQEAMDIGLLVAHRLTFDRMLQGSIRLAVDQVHEINRRVPYQAWIEEHLRILTEAERLGELLPDVEVNDAAQMIVGAFGGVQLMSEVMNDRSDLEERIAVLYSAVARSIATPETLARLDTSCGRGKRLMERVLELEAQAAG